MEYFNVDDTRNLPAYAVDILFNEMGVADFLSQSQCIVNQYPFSIEGGIENECSEYLLVESDLGPVSCHLSSSCMSLECCINTTALPRSIHAFFQINACDEKLTVGIEKFTFETSLVDYDFGTKEHFWLNALFRIDFRIFDLKEKEGYVVDLEVSVCLESGSECIVKQSILSDAVLRKPQCSFKEGFNINNFSITEWMHVKGYELQEELSELDLSFLMADLGLPRFLQSIECEPSDFVTNNKTSCSLNQLLVNLPQDLTCYLPTCNDVKCCLYVKPLRRNFMILLSIDPCLQVLSIEIENMKVQLAFNDLKWNEEQSIFLKGVVRIVFTLENLDGQNAFVLSLAVNACFEFNTECYFKSTIFDKAIFHKRFCEFSTSETFPIKDFSLLEWKMDNDLHTELPLENLFSDLLLEELGLSIYINDPPCQMNRNKSNSGWINSCPYTLMTTLPTNMVCSLDNRCLKLECCIYVTAINRNIKVQYDIDVCGSTVEVGVEQLVMKRNFLDFSWGETKRMNFGGIVRFDFSFSNLENGDQLMTSATISLCFESSSPCDLQTTLLDGLIFPEQICRWDKGFALNDFSLQKWMSEEGLIQSMPWTEYYTAKLLNLLNISPFLLEDTCIDNEGNNSWVSGCSKEIGNGLLQLPESIHCAIGHSCTDVECCVWVDQFNRSLKLQANIDTCAYEITLSIERYQYRKHLFNYTWGDIENIWLFGVVRMSLSVYNLDGEGKYILNMNVSVCLESDSICQTDVQVLSDAVLPKLECDWNSEFVDPNFDMGDWLEKHEISSGHSLTLAETTILYNDLNLSPYIGDECLISGKELNISDIGWATECPFETELHKLPGSTICSIPSFCSGVDCCTKVELLDRNIHSHLYIFTCLNRLDIGIEKMKYTIDLNDFEFGTEKTVSLQGVFKLRFVIEDLKNEGVLLLTLDIQICFSTKTACSENIEIFKNTKLSKPICDMSTGFKIKDFSMDGWLMERGLVAGNIGTLPLSILYEELGISTYLQENVCTIPKSNGTWENECQLIDDLPDLSDNVFCSLEKYCNTIDCCLNSELLQRNFAFSVKVDQCEMKLTLTIEKLKFELSLFDYDWGSENIIDLFGVLRIRLSVENLSNARMYLLNLEIAACLESNDKCETAVIVFNNTLLNKLPCQLDSGFIFQNFSLTSWLTSKGYEFNSYLGFDVTSELLEVLGIVGYLKDEQCDRKSSAFTPSAYGWKKSCQLSVDVDPLSNIMTCNLGESCSSVDCCIDVYLLERSFNVQFNLDPCTNMLEVSIEKLTFDVPLSDITYGTPSRFCLYGMVCIEYSIKNMLWSEIYIVDLNISICFESSSPCNIQSQIFKSTILPKKICGWVNDNNIQNFTLASWFNNRGIPDMANLPSYLANTLENDIGLSMFLNKEQCQRGVTPYLSNYSGCASDCPMETHAPVGDANVSCYIPDYCTAVDICAYIPLINRNVHAFLRLRPCDSLLEIGIEQYQFTVGFNDFKFGEHKTLLLKDVFKLDLRIDDLNFQDVYVVDFKFSTCFVDSSCEKSYAIFDRTVLTKIPCSWDMSFKNENFSLNEWMVDRGIAREQFTNVQRNELFEVLGLAAYLDNSKCYLTDVPFSPSNDGWNSDCPVDITLPSLPSYIGCYVSDTCTSVRCCLEIDIISTSMSFFISMDGCEKQMTVGIEQLTSTIDIDEYKFGSFDRFYLLGVYRIDYMIEYLYGSRKFVVDMNVSACFESHGECEITIPVLHKTILPKVNCDWYNGFNNEDFALEEWKRINNISQSLPLNRDQFDLLANNLGISQYLLENECVLPTNKTTSGWDNSCPLDIYLQPLPDNTSCKMSSGCLNVDCCMFVSDLNRSFSFSLHVDECNFQISASIEDLEITRKLSAFEFNKVIEFDIDGLISLRFVVLNMEYRNTYMLDLDVSVHLEAKETAAMTVKVLDDILVPRIQCQQNAGYVNKSFALDKWKEDNNVTAIDEYQTVKLLEDLAIAPFMLTNQCDIRDDFVIDTTACPIQVNSLNFFGQGSCSLTEICSGIRCCLKSLEISSNFFMEVEIDACKEEVKVAIEKLQFLIPFRNFTWGEVQRFSLYGVFQIEISIVELVKSQIYTLDLRASICLGQNETCNYTDHILQNEYMTSIPCSWSSEFIDADFDFDQWKTKYAYSLQGPLPKTGVEFFFTEIGVDSYLNKKMCDNSAAPYTSDTSWTSDCGLSVSVTDLPNNTKCFIDDKCSDFECCSYVDTLQRSFSIQFKLDTCSQTLSVGVERILQHIPLSALELDVVNKFYLNGFIRLQYMLTNLPIQRTYITNLNLSICFDDNKCNVNLELLKNTVVPHTVCEFNPGYSMEDFSLAQWKTSKHLQSLDDVQQIELMTDLGIKPFIREVECKAANNTYNGECGVLEDFPSSCSLSNSCTKISCCLFSEVLRRNIFYELDYDKCNHLINITIETYSRLMSLYDYEYGNNTVMSLYSTLQINFTIDYLVMSDSHVISLNIKECYETTGSTCASEIEVLTENKFPSVECSMYKNYKIDAFSYTEWLAEMKINASSLPIYAKKILHRDLGTSQYLLLNECKVEQIGWNSDCAENITMLNITDNNTTIACHLHSSCLDLQCCLYVSEVQRSFQFQILFDPCELNFTVAIEKFRYELSLKEVLVGRFITMSLNGILQIEFMLEENSDDEYVLSARLKVCLESVSECNHDIEIFNYQRIKKKECDFGQRFHVADFSLKDWMTKNGIASHDLMSEKERDFLMKYLGLELFLLKDICTTKQNLIEDGFVNIPNGLNETCIRTKNGYSFDCCVYSEVLDRNLWMNFTFDACNYRMEVNLENLQQSFHLLNYEWGKIQKFTTKGVWCITFMVTNVQTEGVFSLDLTLQQCFESGCNSDIKVANDFRIPYPSCENVTNNDTSQLYYGISFDFWKQPGCTAENLSSSIECDALHDDLIKVCKWANECRGIQCCTEFYYSEDKRNAEINFSIDCDKKQLKYSIENKMWIKPIINDMNIIHEDIAETILLDVNVSYSVESKYKVMADIRVCTGTRNANDCQMNFRMSQTFQCQTSRRRRRRRRRSTTDLSPDMDIKELVIELINQGESYTEIHKFIDNALQYQKDLKSQFWQSEALSDSDSSTGYSVAVKALGDNNPQIIKHGGPRGSVNLHIEGAEQIFEMTGYVNDIVQRADQLFVVGKGLSEQGTRLLAAQLANMAIGDIEALLESNNVNPTQIRKVVENFIDLAIALYSDTAENLYSGDEGNPFSSFEFSLRGDYSLPRRNIEFFDPISFEITLGIINPIFTFGAGGYYGLDLGLEGKLIAQTAGLTVVPYGGLICWGELSVGYVLFVGLRLEGRILDLRFPARAEIGFSKFPLDVTLQMDLELTPVSLKLSAIVTLDIDLAFFKFKKVLFNADLWRYSTPTIKTNMIDVSTKEEDESPPQFSAVIENKHSNLKSFGTRAVCDISQIKNRDYTEPAFEISVAAADDKSNLKFFLDVGTFPAGNNVKNNLQLGGPSSVLATSVDEYPSGSPLYFTVYAENSAGSRAKVACMLPTYDTTEPTARITPGFLSTSNPNVIKASILVHDDTELTKAFIGVGYGKGIYGDQLISWTVRDLNERTPLSSSSDPLAQFSDLEDGKFVSTPFIKQTEVHTATACAQLCLNHDHCTSFNYDYGPGAICELLRSIRHYDDVLAQTGLFCHFERLSTGHSIEVNHKNLNLQHNRLHFVNIDLTNDLGYRSIVPSFGILTDYTCPEPGPIVNSYKDYLKTDDCIILIPPDRPDLKRFCTGIHSKRRNHRVIIDGQGSKTVFNGDKQMLDLKYTRANNFIAGNWDGIMDNETDIRAYAFAVGRQICEDIIHPHHDPHKHLMHESQWTHMSVITASDNYNSFPLPSGKYYLTVRAINKVEYGGPLALTVCHSTPYIIDITYPIVYEVFDIKYDEENYVLTFEHNSTDVESDIESVDYCIGNNPRNCDLLSWTRKPTSQYINDTHHIPNGVPAWIRIRITNNVELHTIERANQAIIIDATPPVLGTVYDGPLFKEDLQYTKYSQQICLNWFNFYDPESGIASYEIGVGTSAGLTDVVELKKLKHTEHNYCLTLDENSTLIHNNVYYPIVWAHNGAINQKNVSGVSDGVRVDLTKPERGISVDGNFANFSDMQYSSSKSTVQCQWDHFYDPESGIREYDVQVERKRQGNDWTIIKEWTKFAKAERTAEWRNFHLAHNDKIKSSIKATNGALNDIDTESDGFLIDLTSPLLGYLNDGPDNQKDIQYQVNTAEVFVNFNFHDPESGLKQLRYQLYEQSHGMTHQFYPGTKGEWVEVKSVNVTDHMETGLKLTVGHKYISRLIVINGAGLISTYETNGFKVENTPPMIYWIHVGVLSGLEHLIDGYVYQSDHNGIKVSWSASDPESGITAIQYSVGTDKGAGDILSWIVKETKSDNAYISCSLNDTDTDNSNKPIYYVSLKARNGAGLWSPIIHSSPITVVPEDVTGIVHDGPYEHLENDIDYQADTHTLTIQFSGFESSLHGILEYDWAIGTTPGSEDVQPYLEQGIIHNEEENVVGNGLTSSGFAHTSVNLDHGVAYFSTIRAKTNKGNILQATTDGFEVDTTPPEIMFNTLTGSPLIEPDTVIYQRDQSVLEASWNFTDTENIKQEDYNNIELSWFSVGSVPYFENIVNKTYQDIFQGNEGSLSAEQVKPALAGISNIVTVGVQNKAGLEHMAVSKPVIQDNTAPDSGTVECQKFVQSHSDIKCTWKGFVDKESKIAKYYIIFGSRQGYDDLRSSEEISGDTTEFSAKDVKKDHTDILYATVAAENHVGLSVSAYSESITVDNTPPLPGIVVELSSVANIVPNDVAKTVELNRKACLTEEECLNIDAVCTEALTYLGVAWTHFIEDESEITEYHLAIGSLPGGTDISPFISISTDLNHYVVKHLDLKGQRQVFATVKATNFAGLTTTSHSNGIYMSYLSQGLDPLTHVGIYDSNQLFVGDVDFQSETKSIEARWDVSGDPCPVEKYEWSIEETDGTVLQNFIDMYTSEFGKADQLELKEGRRYYSLLKVRNVLGYVYTLRSDGVTINSNPMLPGFVYDGDITGHDLKVLSSRTMVSANWEGFGELHQPGSISEILTGNKGVDEETKADPNQEVAYYEVALGTDRRFEKTRDNVVPFLNVGLNTSVTFKDLDLEPGFAVYFFTADGGKATPGEINETFNVYQVTSVGVSTFVRIDGLDLVQNSTYFLWIMGVDKAGECNMTYHRFTVDVTQPLSGMITAGPYFNMMLAYTTKTTEIHVKWDGFEDYESGIDVFNLTLWESGTCSEDGNKKLISKVEILGNYTDYSFTNLSIIPSNVYSVRIEAYNRAKLKTMAETSRIVFDDSIPAAGFVSEGSVFTDDIVWWGFLDHIDGTFLHSPVILDDICPLRHISMTDDNWKPMEIKRLNDPDAINWNIEHRLENIHLNSYDNEVSIKIYRDSKEDRIYSAAYMRYSDMKNGGSYQISIRAADGNGIAVTGVTFWDGEKGDLHIFNHQARIWHDIGLCSCCLETNITECLCNCTEYLHDLEKNNGTINENETVFNSTKYDFEGFETVSQHSCGLQIYAGADPYTVTWCRFFNNTGERMSVTTELNFDPSVDFHRYKIDFLEMKDDLLITTCMNVFIDGDQVSELCGIPHLSIRTNLILHVWNKDNMVPVLDVFNLWQTRAAFRDLIMPPEVNALCRYGDPFQGGTNAIVQYEAGVGTLPGSVDIVPFQKVYKPCIPCTDDCSRFVCDTNCKFDGYTLTHFTIKDTAFNASYDGQFYISVKAVLGSGNEIVSSSNGFYIDLTPPEFDEEVMMYIDVRQGEFTPSDFQGSNNTIKAIWLCNDDKNEIKEYEWAIGSNIGFQDLQPFTSTGIYSTGINDTLEGLLEHNTTYYVSIKCTNMAGLTTSWNDSKGITVLLVPPDADIVDAEAFDAEKFDEQVYPPTAVKSEDPTTCGESWTVSTDPNIRRYDFCVGSSLENIDDVVPCVWVGYNTSGIVEIKHGYIYIDNTPYHKLSELRALSEGNYNFDTANEDDNTFQMESGRTLFLFMRLCNKAELCTDKFVNSLLITNEKAVLFRSETGKRNTFQLKDKQTDRRKRSVTALSIEMPNGTVEGQSIVYNELAEENMTARYDSVASTLFKPYIVNPETTFNMTERLLYRRLYSFNFAFTLSPVGQAPLPGPLKLNYPITNGSSSENGTMTMVIHWNPDKQQWQTTNRTCDWENITFNQEYIDGATFILICDTRLSAESIKANQTYFSKETQFALATVAINLINSAPVFVETIIRMDENSEDTQFQLIATDMENDRFIYKLKEKEVNSLVGSITLSNDGILSISLCENCFGNYTVKFTIEDIPEWEEIPPAREHYSLNIEVVSVNDPPNIMVLSPNGTDILPFDPTERILIFREQIGETISGKVAVVIAYDIDGPQHLQMISNTSNASGTFILQDLEYTDIINYVSCSHGKCVSPSAILNPTNVEWKGVYINYTQDNTSFIGIDTIKIVAMDESGTYSDVVSLTLVVMENNCQHGHCKSLNERQYSCDDTRRTEGFDKYYTCECPTSWEGRYCEHDVDECSRGFCEAWKVCDNKIGSYDCYCKATDIICKLSLEVWEFAVIVTAIGFVLLVVVGILIYRKLKSNIEAVDKEKIPESNTFAEYIFGKEGILGPSLRRFAKVSPMALGEDGADHFPNAPPMSAFISHTLHADVHRENDDDTDTEDDSTKDTYVTDADLCIQETISLPISVDNFDIPGMSKPPASAEDLDIERTSSPSISAEDVINRPPTPTNTALKQQSDTDFVHPAPKFNIVELAAELKRKREEMEEIPDIVDHPPPELNQTHAITKFRRRKGEPKSMLSVADTQQLDQLKQLEHTNPQQEANDDTRFLCGEAERNTPEKHTD
ncbi:uncharacterized protein LOC132750448 [Ruditapes philippinarum]|uniref:uncharacterized protein LOC132750448 n=1 Tax=Ruditapes philippinarum TaxID=129788 RepID=UPI00295B0F3E|nr:uncharacterized protein LOC132750448 [Ruditapes philippinarum]